jgi:hypothetical protein
MKTRSAVANRILGVMRQKTEEIVSPVRERLAMEMAKTQLPRITVEKVKPEKSGCPPMVLLSCTMPMGSRYAGRGARRPQLVG